MLLVLFALAKLPGIAGSAWIRNSCNAAGSSVFGWLAGWSAGMVYVQFVSAHLNAMTAALPVDQPVLLPQAYVHIESDCVWYTIEIISAQSVSLTAAIIVNMARLFFCLISVTQLL